MSERAPGRARRVRERARPPRDPFAWMALRRHDMALLAGLRLVYMDERARRLRARLVAAPPDLEVAVYTILPEEDLWVEVLHYGHSDGHPHLDVYLTWEGSAFDFALVESIKQTFYAARRGVGLDMVRRPQPGRHDLLRVALVYCPRKDPAARHHLRPAEEATADAWPPAGGYPL